MEAIIKGTGCDAAWLLTGEGVPFPGEKSLPGYETSAIVPVHSISPVQNLPEPNAIRQRGIVNMTRKSQRFSVVGSAAADESQGSRAGIFPADASQIWDEVEIPETTHFVKVKGDSMAPVLLDGQYAMVGPEHYGSHDQPQNREIVVAEVTVREHEQAGSDARWEGVYVKRVEDGDSVWVFHSINITGESFSVAKGNCRLWPVIGVYFAGKGKPPRED